MRLHLWKELHCTPTLQAQVTLRNLLLAIVTTFGAFDHKVLKPFFRVAGGIANLTRKESLFLLPLLRFCCLRFLLLFPACLWLRRTSITITIIPVFWPRVAMSILQIIQ